MTYMPRGGRRGLILLLAPLGIGPRACPIACPNAGFDITFLSTLGELREATYSDKASIAERLSQGGHPSVYAALTALLEDRLYFRNSLIKEFSSSSPPRAIPSNLIDPLSLKDAGPAPADSLTKIGTNNGLRHTLRTTVAHFALSNTDAAVRLQAVRDMLQSLDDTTVALLRKQLAVETNSGVRKELATGLALAALEGSDTKSRLDGIATLESKSVVSQDVRNRLRAAGRQISRRQLHRELGRESGGAPRRPQWERSTNGAAFIPASRPCSLA